MKNLTKNQHGVYTYRRHTLGTSIRVSLQTKDDLEALRITQQINATLRLANISDPKLIKAMINKVLADLQPELEQQRIQRVHDILGVTMAQQQEQSEPLSVLFVTFVKEKARTKAWTGPVMDRSKVTLYTLIDHIGDKPVNEVTHKDVQRVKDQLQRLPAHMVKKPEYKGKTVKQVLRMNIPESELMAVSTINKHLKMYATFYKWAVKNGYAETNVFDEACLKDTRSKKSKRSPFTVDEVNTLFAARPITEYSVPWRYWLPVLALYTGARINELCQLRVKDVQEINGIYAISVTDESEDQSIKTAASRRLIPVHQDLVKLGFIRYIQRYTKPDQRIFPELKRSKTRLYSDKASSWFSGVKNAALSENLDSENLRKKVFHSYRHTLIDVLTKKLKLHNSPIVKAIVGHTDSEMTTGTYGSDYEIEDLNEVMQRIDFEGLGIKVPLSEWAE